MIASTGRTRVARHRATTGDDGFTLVEFIVAMGIFAGLLAIFATAVSSFASTTVRINRTADQSAHARTAFNLLDKQVRAATAINPPGANTANVNWYVEFQQVALLPNTCTQWVLRTDTHTLAMRTWVSGPTTAQTPTPWRTIATDVVNYSTPSTTATNVAPFTFTAATAGLEKQQLSVNLLFRQSLTGPVTTIGSTYVARNSSSTSVTNPVGSALTCTLVSGVMRP